MQRDIRVSGPTEARRTTKITNEVRATARGMLLCGVSAMAAALLGCDESNRTSSSRGPEGGAFGASYGALAAVDSGGPALKGKPPETCAELNAGAACTPTEQRFMDKSPACYSCLANAACLDNAKFGDKNHECEDLKGVATGGAKAHKPNAELCLATIDCILRTRCASSDVATCYCGGLLGSACATATTPGQGPCAEAEADGSNHLVTEPASAVSPALASIDLPAGKADAIFACAKMNNCEAVCSR